MPFPERLKLNVKKKANFTCCWCLDRRNKVDVHHIVPESENGPDTEENAAPLCGTCHTLYGGNPDLRKEIRARRDSWYEMCARQYELALNWPLGSDVPLLDFYRELPASGIIPTKGIRFTDRALTSDSSSPSLYLSVYFVPAPIYPPTYHLGSLRQPEKWLSLSASMWGVFHFGIEVCAWHSYLVLGLIRFLRGEDENCALAGVENIPGVIGRPTVPLARSLLSMFRHEGENRLILSTITSERASISIHARFSTAMMAVFADYLEEIGFAEPD